MVMVEPWRVVFRLHRDTGQVQVGVVGERPPRPMVTWEEGLAEAVRLVGPGVTIRARVLVPAGSGTYRGVTEYPLQLPRRRAGGRS